MEECETNGALANTGDVGVVSARKLSVEISQGSWQNNIKLDLKNPM
jgi:hypothetical protein